jgi:hypothetical protein
LNTFIVHYYLTLISSEQVNDTRSMIHMVKLCTETFLVNVRSMHVLPRVTDAELLQSKLNLDFTKFTNDLFCVMSMLKSPHNKIRVSVSGFMLRNINLMASKRQAFET